MTHTPDLTIAPRQAGMMNFLGIITRDVTLLWLFFERLKASIW